MKTSRLWRVLAWCVALLAMGLTLYRANAQPIAHDEALQYEWFLDGSVQHVLQYNQANHILFALMAKPIVWGLGVSELKLRAPSLLGTAIYLLAAYLLCRRLFGEGILLFFSVALLCLNPQILEFMPAARGYILGLAGLMMAMYAMAVLVELGEFDPENRRWRWGCRLASVALALSVAPNVTNVVPAAFLVLTFSAVAMGGFRRLLKFSARKLQSLAKYLLAPGAAVGFCILWPYVIQMRPANFRVGLDTAFDCLRDVFTASFLYRWTDDLYSSSLGAAAPAAGSWQERVTAVGIFVLTPLLFCIVAAGVTLAWRERDRLARNGNAAFRVLGGSAVACTLMVFAVYAVARTNYPNARYCLFFIPLYTVAALLAWRKIAARFPSRALRAAGVLLAGLVLADYALSIQVKEFRYQAYDVISLKLYQAIADDAQKQGLKSARVGGTWWYEPEINFYRRKFKATWMADYDVVDKSYFWRSPNALAPPEYDYFVYIPASDPGLTGVRTVFHDELRQLTVVAKVRR